MPYETVSSRNSLDSAHVWVLFGTHTHTYLPLSTTHTDKSWLCCWHNCLRRIDAANPAGPPPTINTSKAIHSRGSSFSSGRVVVEATVRNDCCGKEDIHEEARGVEDQQLVTVIRRVTSRDANMLVESNIGVNERVSKRVTTNNHKYNNRKKEKTTSHQSRRKQKETGNQSIGSCPSVRQSAEFANDDAVLCWQRLYTGVSSHMTSHRVTG